MVVGHDDRMTLIEHLDELRSRIVVGAFALVAGDRGDHLQQGRVQPVAAPLDQLNVPESARKITTFSPAEPFMVSLKVWAYVGVILASPIIIYEFWAFVGPAFAPTEKKYLYPIAAACSGLFLFGVVFGYLFVLPRGLAWLLWFNDGYFNVQNRASDYFTFTATFLLAFGLVFELPVVIVLATRVGVVDTKWLQTQPQVRDPRLGDTRRRGHAEPGCVLDARHVHTAAGPLRDLRADGEVRASPRERLAETDDGLARGPA